MISSIQNLVPKSIRGRILAITASVTLLIAVITVSVCFAVFQHFLRKNQIQSAEFGLKVTAGNISSHMENILNFCQWCQSNSEISHYLESFEEQTAMPSISSENYWLRTIALNAYDRLKEEYYNTHSSDYITRILISPANRHNYLQISDTYATSTSSAADAVFSSPLFQPRLTAPGFFWDGLYPDPLLAGSETSLFLPVVRPIRSTYGTKMTGWVFLSISDRIFADYLKDFPKEPDSALYLTIGSLTYRYADGVFVQAQPSWTLLEDLSSQAFQTDSQAFRILLPNGQKRIAVTCSLGQENWRLSQILSQNAYQGQRQIYLFIVSAIVFFIILAGIVLFLLLNRMIGSPVQSLKQRIGAISQGDFSRDPSIEWENEFGVIGRGINQMSSDVSALMNARVENEKQKKDLEYQILQSQINPHFLYNTLNSIKWMATIQGASGISEMTTALARLLKSISKGSSARIPLREELALVNDYFLIQQYRYGGGIQLTCQVEEDSLYRCLIHRFTLQPIVENALFHGIEPKGGAGTIDIRARRGPNVRSQPSVVITVTDNGVGMTRETIERVLKGDAAPTADFFRQVGISNVNRRIQYDCGEEYGIAIESEPGVYTTMIITLPFVSDDRLQ